jgi:hypothetical protein
MILPPISSSNFSAVFPAAIDSICKLVPTWTLAPWVPVLQIYEVAPWWLDNQNSPCHL